MRYLFVSLMLCYGRAHAATGIVDANGGPQLPSLTVVGSSTMTYTRITGPLIVGNGATSTQSNVERFLSSAAFSGAASFTLPLNAPNYSTVDCSLVATDNTTTGLIYLQFNGDTSGSDYTSNVFATRASASATTSSSPGYIQLMVGSVSVGAILSTRFEYIANSGNYQYVTFGPGVDYDSASAQWLITAGGGNWTGSSSPAYATIGITAGTMTGYVRCTYIAY